MVALFECLSVDAAARRDDLGERLFQAALGTLDLFTVYLGHRLGLYRTLADIEPATSTELATAAGLHERYVREWLEQQTVTGILECENPAAAASDRRFALPPGYAAVLVDVNDPYYLMPLPQSVTGFARPLGAVAAAFRAGGGVPYTDYGADVRDGQAGMNRNLFLQLLGREYLPAIPDLDARLRADPAARIADIGCGVGWSCIGIARSYPSVIVDGFDLDEASVEEGRALVAAENLSHRINLQVRDAANLTLSGSYDLVIAFESIHDMSDPVGALRTMRRIAADDGTVLVMEQRVADTFDPAAGDVERLMYGYSVLHCLPVGMVEHPSAATGTVLRTETLRRYARAAGFAEIEVLPLDNLFFKFYRLSG